MEFQVESNRLFYEKNGKLLAEITFPLVEGTEKSDAPVANFNHTFVDPSLEGQGIASQLVYEALDVCEKNGWKVKPTCPYVVHWFKKRPNYADRLAEPLK